MSPHSFSRTQKIRFSHCDPANILYFPHVFEFVNTMVEDWFEEGLGVRFDKFHMQHDMGNPVVTTRCEFLKPCHFGEDLTLELAPYRIGRSSMELAIVAHVAGETRMRLAHRTAMISMDTFRAISIPDALRERANSYLGALPAPEAPRLAPAAREIPSNAFRARRLVRYAHCDPGRIVYYARYFDMFDAVLEDWFAEGLGAPLGADLIGARALRTPSLAIACEFLRPCRLGERLEFALWPLRLGRSSLDLALSAGVAGEERLRAVWTLCTVSHAKWKAVPIPEDLRARMQGFLTPGAAG